MDVLSRLEGRRNTKGSLRKKCKCNGRTEKVGGREGVEDFNKTL